MATDYDKDLDPAGIGYLCLRWSYFEYLFAVVIWQLLKLEQSTGAIVTGGLDIRPRAEMAKRLAKHLKFKSKLQSAISRAQAFVEENSGERNLIVHGIYGLNPDTGTIYAEVHRQKYKFTRQPVNNARIAKLTKSLDTEIYAFETALYGFSFLDAHGGGPSP